MMGKKKNNYWSPMQTEKFQPKGTRIMPETDRPRFRHYPFTLGLGFLGLQRKPMIDSFCPWTET